MSLDIDLLDLYGIEIPEGVGSSFLRNIESYLLFTWRSNANHVNLTRYTESRKDLVTDYSLCSPKSWLLLESYTSLH